MSAKQSHVGTKRLMKEHQDILANPNPNYVAEPDPDNLFHWHYCIYNLKDGPYEGGYYHGILKFPNEYPMKPPSVIMFTPSGRFSPDVRICLTISDWHPESWNPVWKVESIIMGLIIFILTDESSIGSLHQSAAERKKFAKESLNWNLKINKTGRFELIFDRHMVRLGLREGKIEEPPLQKKASLKAVEEPPLKKKASLKKEEAKEPEKVAPILGKRGAAKVEPEKPVAAAKKREVKEEEKKDEKAKPAAAGAAKKLDDNFLYVQCIKVGPKIRLRIVNSTCYNNNWNCQGPRSIRREGVVYRIDNPKVKVMYNSNNPGKAFYKLSNDTSIYK